MTTHVLAVCTGNICRSPAVERLLAAGLADDDVTVASAGTGALVGQAISPPMADLVTAAGGDVSGFAARRLVPDHLREADLVLALTLRHRRAVVELLPGAVRRTFTLRELARLAARVAPDDLPDGTPGERLRALLPLAAAQRTGGTQPDDDVVDPYRGSSALYQRSFDELRAPVEALLALVRT